jgi:hypothetical protein
MCSLLSSLLLTTFALAQTVNLGGKITDPHGRPVMAASVRVKNSRSGTATDSLGVFTIKAAPTDSLLITAIGYDDTIVAAGSQTALNLTLNARPTTLTTATVSGAVPNAGIPGASEATRELILANAFDTYLRSAEFSNGAYQTSSYNPAVRGSAGMQNTLTVGAGALNTINSGVMLPVVSHQEDTRGSRYLLKNYAMGLIVDNGGNIINDSLSRLNYDKVDGQLMIAQDARNYLEVDKDRVVAFALKTPDTAFVFLNVPVLSKSNYFLLIANGPKYSIYKSIRTKFVKANYRSTGLVETGNNYDEYVDKETYFWIDAKNAAGVLELKKKSIREAFAAEKTKLEDFFAHHKYDDIDDALLKKLIFYLNQ